MEPTMTEKIDVTKILKLAAANGIQLEDGVYFIPAEGGAYRSAH
jgi:hypothetical protein